MLGPHIKKGILILVYAKILKLKVLTFACTGQSSQQEPEATASMLYEQLSSKELTTDAKNFVQNYLLCFVWAIASMSFIYSCICFLLYHHQKYFILFSFSSWSVRSISSTSLYWMINSTGIIGLSQQNIELQSMLRKFNFNDSKYLRLRSARSWTAASTSSTS